MSHISDGKTLLGGPKDRFKPVFMCDQPCLMCEVVTLTVEINFECLCQKCLNTLWDINWKILQRKDDLR